MKRYLNSLALIFIAISFSITSPAKALSQANDLSNRYKDIYVELNFYSGLGSVIGAVLGALQVYDQGNMAGLTVHLDHLYLDPAVGPNWWEYFFEPIHLGNQHAPHYQCTMQDAIDLAYLGLPTPSINNYALIQKYVRIKSHIQAEIDEFVRQHFESFYVIGVHHRGTDKNTEWPIVSYEKTYQTIKQVIKKSYPFPLRKKVKIFVATDDQKFIDYLENLFPKQLIYNNFTRSADGSPLHIGAVQHYTSNYLKGKEAIIDCLLMSRCHILIRPQSSCLSLVSTFFNPYSQVISLTEN